MTVTSRRERKKLIWAQSTQSAKVVTRLFFDIQTLDIANFKHEYVRLIKSSLSQFLCVLKYYMLECKTLKIIYKTLHLNYATLGFSNFWFIVVFFVGHNPLSVTESNVHLKKKKLISFQTRTYLLLGTRWIKLIFTNGRRDSDRMWTREQSLLRGRQALHLL